MLTEISENLLASMTQLFLLDCPTYPISCRVACLGVVIADSHFTGESLAVSSSLYVANLSFSIVIKDYVFNPLSRTVP